MLDLHDMRQLTETHKSSPQCCLLRTQAKPQDKDMQHADQHTKNYY